VSADLLGEPISYKIGAPGRHLVDNSLAVLAAVKLAGGDLARAMLALQKHEQPKGRGRRHALMVRGGRALLIDESYNANPTSMRAAIALLGQADSGKAGRRIAVLGDMLELGPQSPQLHAGLIEPLTDAKVDLVFACGPQMQHLWQDLPRPMRGAYAETSAELEGPLLDALRPADTVMIKGSLGSRTGRLVDALTSRFGEENQI